MWLSGASATLQAGMYGSKGAASVNNRPGARGLSSIDIHPSGGSLYVFGGNGYDASSQGIGYDKLILQCII